MKYAQNSPDFTGKTVAETQKHFDDLRASQKSHHRRRAREIKDVDLDEQFKKILTVLEKEITKLMDLSHKFDPLEPKSHDALIDYAKLIGTLKKQLADEFRDMDPKELEKLAANEPG